MGTRHEPQDFLGWSSGKVSQSGQFSTSSQALQPLPLGCGKNSSMPTVPEMGISGHAIYSNRHRHSCTGIGRQLCNGGKEGPSKTNFCLGGPGRGGLRGECSSRGWQAQCAPIEVQFLCRALKLIAKNHDSKNHDTAEKAPRWLWVKGVIHEPHTLLGFKPGARTPPTGSTLILKDLNQSVSPGYITDDVSLCITRCAKEQVDRKCCQLSDILKTGMVLSARPSFHHNTTSLSTASLK